MINIGKLNELSICRKTKEGHFLKSEDEDVKASEHQEVFMPYEYGPKVLVLNQLLLVFVYLDSDDSLIATTNFPSAIVDEYALMKEVSSKAFGNFFDWGFYKDLLVPDTEQKENIKSNGKYIIRVCLDERTNRIYGTTKLGKYIKASIFDIAEGDEVSITPAVREELGYRSIINKKFIGMIYHNEIFNKVSIGKEVKGFVKKIREDGLVDVALQVQGFKNLLDSKDKILSYLKENEGSSPLHDKSSPLEIRNTLGMSKQTFKNTIGMLYKDKKIIIKKDGIILAK